MYYNGIYIADEEILCAEIVDERILPEGQEFYRKDKRFKEKILNKKGCEMFSSSGDVYLHVELKTGRIIKVPAERKDNGYNTRYTRYMRHGFLKEIDDRIDKRHVNQPNGGNSPEIC
jgi:hypothetical protein